MSPVMENFLFFKEEAAAIGAVPGTGTARCRGLGQGLPAVLTPMS